MTSTPWVKASKSDAEGNCVEMRAQDDDVQVRDTKQNGRGPTLTLSSAGFKDWIDNAKNGRLDALI